ncbi:MAG: PilZ domain-containing protein [Phycisphaerae bacterium]|jgi:hypothetical protein
MNQETGRTSERRKHRRLSVFSFLHATATVAQQPTTDKNAQAKYWTGLLEDISYDGAQVRMPLDCHSHLCANQNVALAINTTFIEDISIDLNARIKYVNLVENENNIRVGIQFTGLEKNPREQDKILRLCDYGNKLKATEAACVEPSA